MIPDAGGTREPNWTMAFDPIKQLPKEMGFGKSVFQHRKRCWVRAGWRQPRHNANFVDQFCGFFAAMLFLCPRRWSSMNCHHRFTRQVGCRSEAKEEASEIFTLRGRLEYWIYTVFY